MGVKGKYTHGGTKRGKNVKGHGIAHYTMGHRKAITGHTMRPTATHGHMRAT